jgi:hypothetical protein
MASSTAPYDPLARYGSGWRKTGDGTYVRVVVHAGRLFPDSRGPLAYTDKVAIVLKRMVLEGSERSQTQ